MFVASAGWNRIWFWGLGLVVVCLFVQTKHYLAGAPMGRYMIDAETGERKSWNNGAGTTVLIQGSGFDGISALHGYTEPVVQGNLVRYPIPVP